MNSLRKAMGFLIAPLMFAAFALLSGAALGADKQYTLKMSPVTGTSPTAMTALFTNKGNSSFNSFTLTVPAGYRLGATPTSTRGELSVSGQVITVLNINLPTGSGQSVTVTMPGVTTSATCSSGVGGNWEAVVWTGSTLSGSTFAQVGPSTTSTTIGAQCYTVTPSASVNGTISPNTAQTVIAGATTAFTLTPATGYNIAPVTGTCGGTLVGNTFTTAAVTANCTVIANFAIKTFAVTPSSTGNGTISPNTAQTVNYNGTTSFTLTPATGYNSASVGGTCGGSLVGNTFTTAAVTADCTVVANFAINTYVVTPSTSGNGSISPATPQSVTYLGTKSFTLTPATGYQAASAGGNCGGTISGNTLTTAPVTGNCNAIANFAPVTYTVSTLTGAGAGGNITPSSQQVTYPGTASVTVTPDTGYYITSVSGCGVTRTSGDGIATSSYTTASTVTASCTVTASFAQKTMTINVPSSATLGDPFTITVAFTPPNLPPGASVTLSSSNCTLSSGSGSLAADGSTLTFNQVTITEAPSLQCLITATAAGGAYATAIQTISPIFTGTLGCGEPYGNPKAGNLAINTVPPLAYIGIPDWGLVRAANNKDGNPCTVPVPFQFQFNAVNNTAAFIVPDTLGQKVAVEYVLLWRPVPAATLPAGGSGLLYPRAELAWLKKTDGSWFYVPALACVDDDVEQVDGSPLPIIPDATPFNAGGAGNYTMPIGYRPGDIALMCVAQEGSTSVGGNPALVQFWHKVIDFADGGVRLSE